MTRNIAILAALVLVVGLGTGVFAVLMGRGNECNAAAVAGQGAIGGPFELTDQHGQRVNSEQLLTAPALIYFGYTFCPDVCPFDVARNASAVDILAERGIKVQPVFITIDPARDTVQALADYAEYTHDDLIALTGSEAEVATAAKAYRVYYRQTSEDDDYLLDHTAFTYLMGPDGFIDFFRNDLTPVELADRVACHI